MRSIVTVFLSIIIFCSNFKDGVAQGNASTAEMGFLKMNYAYNPSPPIKRITKYEYSIPKSENIEYTSELDGDIKPFQVDVFNSFYKLDSTIYYRKNGEVRNFFVARYDSLQRIIEFKDPEKYAELGLVSHYSYPEEGVIVEYKARNDGKESTYVQRLDQNNKCIAEITINNQQDTSSMILYSYNMLGQTQSRVFIKKGKLTYSQVYLYDSMGMRIKLVSFNEKGELQREESISSSVRPNRSRYQGIQKDRSRNVSAKGEKIYKKNTKNKFREARSKSSKNSESMSYYDQYGNLRKQYHSSHYNPKYISITYIDIEYVYD